MTEGRPAEVPTDTHDLVVPAGATWTDLAAPLRHLLDPAPSGEGPRAVVVATSGSSGTPKRVRLGAAALRASGLATAQRLDGHGRWILALPTHHVAGLQVLARSALAGSEPVALDPGRPFTPAAFASAVAALGDPADRPHAPLALTSLVPTQLRRLVEDPTGREALSLLDAVLLGGSAADPDLVERARATGCRVLHTYGMSETCGGCVYDGTPLAGVVARVDPAEDRIHLGGPVLADGYLDDPALSAQRFVTDAAGRWFVTDDRGRLDPGTGTLHVLGRVDDVIVTGGHKVEPRDVEHALRDLPGTVDALVVGVPDREWGQVVGALLVGADAERLADLRAALPAHALPRRVASVDGIPQLPSGKPDRAAAVDLLARGGRMVVYPR